MKGLMKKVVHSVYAFLAVLVIAGLTLTAYQPSARGESKAWPKAISIGGTSMGSTGYAVAVAIAEMVKRHVGITATGETATGSLENMTNLRKGSMEMGYTNTFDLYEAYNGKGAYAKQGAMPSLRQVLRGHGVVMNFITPVNSDIQTPADLKGKRFAYGSTRSLSSVACFNALLKAYGLTKDDMKLIPTKTAVEANDALKTGMADAIFFPGGFPSGNFVELANTMKVRFVSLDEAGVKRIAELDPSLAALTVPAGLYPGQDKPLHQPGWVSIFVVREDLPEDLAYAIVKAVYDNYDEFKGFHPACAEYVLKDALQNFVAPWHPGAVRYFKEKGIWTKKHDQLNERLLK